MNKYLKIGLVLIIAYIFFRYLLTFVSPFIVGFLIALLLEPLVKLLIIRGGFRRSLASFVSLIIFMTVGVSIGVWGVSAIVREAGEFLEAAPGTIESLQAQLASLPYAEGILQRLGLWLSEQSVQMVAVVPGMLIAIILILVSAFFFSRDRGLIFELANRWCPQWIAQYAVPIGHRLNKAAGGFLKTEFILTALVAVVCVAVLWLMQNPYAIMLGIAIAILDSLPILGAGIILWPWAGYLAFTGNLNQAAWLIVLYGVVTVIRNVLGPKILGEQIDMHPLAALMAIFIGVKAFGVVGVLAGPALLIATRTIVNNEHI